MAHGSGARQVKLDRESELRIEVGNDAPLKLRLLNCTAEIFGTELPPDFWLTFPPRLKFAVFTWNGATIEMDGSTETDYTADETPNISYVNVHAVLEERRRRAKPLPPDDPNSQAPRSALPIGAEPAADPTRLALVTLWYSVLAFPSFSGGSL